MNWFQSSTEVHFALSVAMRRPSDALRKVLNHLRLEPSRALGQRVASRRNRGGQHRMGFWRGDLGEIKAFDGLGRYNTATAIKRAEENSAPNAVEQM